MWIWVIFSSYLAFTHAASVGDACTTLDGSPGYCQRTTKCPADLAYLRTLPESEGEHALEALARKCPLRPHRPTNPGICCKKQVGQTWENHPSCGLVDSPKIHGGEETSIGEFPWMVLLGYMIKGEIQFSCGGVLIHNRWVLTAAHCVLDTIRTVRLGEHTLSTSPDCKILRNRKKFCYPMHLDVKVLRAIKHPDYSRSMFVNDIGLVELERSVTYTDEIKPICLPLGAAGVMNLEQMKMTVAGWGRTEETGDNGSDVLMKLVVPVARRAQCSAVYDRYTAGSVSIGPKQMCAGGEVGKDACKGDSGSGLMKETIIDGKTRWTVFGVVSYGPQRCGMPGIPGVYARVSQYVNWITSIVHPRQNNNRGAAGRK